MSLHADLVNLNNQVNEHKQKLLIAVLLPLIEQYNRVELCGIDLSGIRFKVYNIYKPEYIQDNMKLRFEEFNVYTTSALGRNDLYTVYFDISIKGV